MGEPQRRLLDTVGYSDKDKTEGRSARRGSDNTDTCDRSFNRLLRYQFRFVSANNRDYARVPSGCYDDEHRYRQTANRALPVHVHMNLKTMAQNHGYPTADPSLEQRRWVFGRSQGSFLKRKVVLETQPTIYPATISRVALKTLCVLTKRAKMAGEETNGTAPVKQDATTLASRLQHLSLAAQTVHADDFLNSHSAVAPPMHVSTTFRYSRNPDDLSYMVNTSPHNPHDSHIYSRVSAPNTARFEAILTSILRGPALSYSSGLSAFHAMVVFLNPRRIAIGGGYHGSTDRKLQAAEALATSPELAAHAERAGFGLLAHASNSQLNSSLTWDDLKWIKREWGGPVVLKGIQTPEDAARAADLGVDGVLLSNHGGRQMHDAPDALTTLLEIRTYYPGVLDKLEIFLDGGCRDGADVLKAVALGAKAVGVGRPFFYALAAYGEKGVERCLDIFADELVTGMRLVGMKNLGEARPERVNASRLLNEIWRPEKSRL
ncbi:hypothetical protein CHU98_g9065 [Xylaria longipes]|nr:hypothetical protein CHU98_g9065 [Xylaria longipes]